VVRCCLHVTERYRSFLSCAVLAALACREQPPRQPAGASIADSTGLSSAVPVRVPTGSWPEPGFDFVAVAQEGTTPTVNVIATRGAWDEARGKYADTMAVDLVGPTGLLGTAIAHLDSPSRACAARSASITDSSAWRIALPAGRVEALTLDPLADLSGADSLGMASLATRIAARAPADTSEALHGLPYVVQGAWRFMIEQRTALIVVASRTLALEAFPRSEHVLVIAEREPTASDWTIEFAERRVGAEQEVAIDDVLAALRLKSSQRFALIVERVSRSTSQLLLFVHEDSSWVLRWAAPTEPCAR
jgi:hypothetical protein